MSEDELEQYMGDVDAACKSEEIRERLDDDLYLDELNYWANTEPGTSWVQ